MNIPLSIFQKTMAQYTGGGNHNYTFFSYYDYYTYEIESFNHWEDEVNVETLNTYFIVISIVIGVLDSLLLVTVFSASTREKSASWYLYHLIFVTLLQVIFSLPRMEADLHNDFGTCMLFSFIEWTLTLVYSINLALMDIEILTTVVVSNAKWKLNPQKRFHISLTTTWVFCILFSVFVKFYGHDERSYIPICFNVNKTSEILGRVTRDWIPSFVVIILTIVGVILFIRTKRSPESNTSNNRTSLQYSNEWFAFFMTSNCLVILTEVLLYEMYMNILELEVYVAITMQMTAFLIHIGLPLGCLMLEPVRTTCLKWPVTGFQFMMGIKRSSESSVADTQILTMEECE